MFMRSSVRILILSQVFHTQHNSSQYTTIGSHIEPWVPSLNIHTNMGWWNQPRQFLSRLIVGTNLVPHLCKSVLICGQLTSIFSPSFSPIFNSILFSRSRFQLKTYRKFFVVGVLCFNCRRKEDDRNEESKNRGKRVSEPKRVSLPARHLSHITRHWKWIKPN